MRATRIENPDVNLPGDVTFTSDEFATLQKVLEIEISEYTAVLNKIKLLREGE